MFSIIMYTLAIVLLLVSLKKDKKKTKIALKKSWKAFENILPQFITIIILIGIILVILDNQAISNMIGSKSGFVGVMISAGIGSITLIPGFVAFPLAKILLENGSGIFGILISLLLGSAAAGPLYAAFPIAGTFLKKGASLFNILIFIGAWSTTKLPMILFEASSLGWKFTLTRLILDIIVIFAIAFITNSILTKNDKDEIYLISKN